MISRFDLANFRSHSVFFLYFSGRLYSTQGLLETAYKQFHLAINAQKEYIQLQHICHWDLGLVSLAMGDWANGYECFNILNKVSPIIPPVECELIRSAAGFELVESNLRLRQSNVALRTEEGEVESGRDHARCSGSHATNRWKIHSSRGSEYSSSSRILADSRITRQKFVARRAKKYVHQGNRLVLPGIELGYVLNCMGMAPRFALFETHLHQISAVLAELHACKNPASWGKHGDEYWDGQSSLPL